MDHSHIGWGWCAVMTFNFSSSIVELTDFQEEAQYYYHHLVLILLSIFHPSINT